MSETEIVDEMIAFETELGNTPAGARARVERMIAVAGYPEAGPGMVAKAEWSERQMELLEIEDFGGFDRIPNVGRPAVDQETGVVYTGKRARIFADKDSGLVAAAYLDLPVDYVAPKGAEIGVVEYYVERAERTLSGSIHWSTEAVFGAPMLDPALRSEAYAKALKMAGAIEEIPLRSARLDR